MSTQLTPEPASQTRARSSSTAGNITTARIRQLTIEPLDDSPLVDPPLVPIRPIPPPSMFNVLLTVASRAIPFQDSLPSKHKLKNSIDYGYLSQPYPNEKPTTQREGDGVSSYDGAQGPLPAVFEQSQPPIPKPTVPSKSKRRSLSPFSSLFISPPSPLPPPATSSPRSSHSPRFPHLHLHIPSNASLLPPPRVLIPLLAVCSLFFISFLPVLFGIWSLPIHSLKSIPRTVNDIKSIANQLNAYAASSYSGRAHVVAVLAVTSVWKNAWSVPGSAVMNILAGTVMDPISATLLQTTFTTLGSICSTLLSKPLAPVISHLFPRALSLTRSAFEGTPATSPVEIEKEMSDEVKRTPIWVRLTVLRLVGVVPWSALNLACGICDVPLVDCAIGGFIGMLPWTAVTVQIGDILGTIASNASSSDVTVSSLLMSPSLIAKLVFLSLLSLGPVLLRDRLSGWVSKKPKLDEKEKMDL